MSRQWILGFGPSIVPPGKQRELKVLPEVVVRVNGVLAAGDRADLFLVDVVIDEKSQLTGPVPFAVFPVGRPHEVLFDVAPADKHIRVVVENRGKVPRKVGLNLLGEADI